MKNILTILAEARAVLEAKGFKAPPKGKSKKYLEGWNDIMDSIGDPVPMSLISKLEKGEKPKNDYEQGVADARNTLHDNKKG